MNTAETFPITYLFGKVTCSALKWGLVLTLLGVAFGIIGATNLPSDAPGAWGILFAATGVGLLAFHAIANKLR